MSGILSELSLIVGFFDGIVEVMRDVKLELILLFFSQVREE